MGVTTPVPGGKGIPHRSKRIAPPPACAGKDLWETTDRYLYTTHELLAQLKPAGVEEALLEIIDGAIVQELHKGFGDASRLARPTRRCHATCAISGSWR